MVVLNVYKIKLIWSLALVSYMVFLSYLFSFFLPTNEFLAAGSFILCKQKIRGLKPNYRLGPVSRFCLFRACLENQSTFDIEFVAIKNWQTQFI